MIPPEAAGRGTDMVELDQWRTLFLPHILRRGLDYYEEGAVRALERRGTSSGPRCWAPSGIRYPST